MRFHFDFTPLRRAWDYLVRFVLRRKPQLAANTNVRRAKQEKVTDSQAFYFRETILDDLDSYFVHLKNMKRADRDSYNLYSKIGATLLPDTSLTDSQELSPWFRQALPTFGAIAMGIGEKTKAKEKKEHCWYPRFICFTKYDRYHRPMDLQAANAEGTCYKVALFYDDVDKRPGVVEMGLVLARDGTIYTLKHRLLKKVKIRHKRGKERTSLRTQVQWGFPEEYAIWAKEHNTTVEAHLAQLFIVAANMFEVSLSGITSVTVKSPKGLIAKFNVDPTRTPYFFKDREHVIAEAGHKKKIFHIVRTHARESKNGSVSYVKSHFRGLRAFMWNGHAISITVPVREHLSLGDFDVPGLDAEHKIPGKKMTMGQVGSFLTGHIEKELADKNISIH